MRQDQAKKTKAVTGNAVGEGANATNMNIMRKDPMKEQELFSELALGGGGARTAAAAVGLPSGKGGSDDNGQNGSTRSSSTTSSPLLRERHAAESSGGNGASNDMPDGNFEGTFRHRPPPRHTGRPDSDDGAR